MPSVLDISDVSLLCYLSIYTHFINGEAYLSEELGGTRHQFPGSGKNAMLSGPRIRKSAQHLLLGECGSPGPSVTQLTACTAQPRALPRRRASPFSRPPDSPPRPRARLGAGVSCVQVLSAELAGCCPGRKAVSSPWKAAQPMPNSAGGPPRVSLSRQADGLAGRVGRWICRHATRILAARPAARPRFPSGKTLPETRSEPESVQPLKTLAQARALLLFRQHLRWKGFGPKAVETTPDLEANGVWGGG